MSFNFSSENPWIRHPNLKLFVRTVKNKDFVCAQKAGRFYWISRSGPVFTDGKIFEIFTGIHSGASHVRSNNILVDFTICRNDNRADTSGF
jgi:hypothetical protein